MPVKNNDTAHSPTLGQANIFFSASLPSCFGISSERQVKLHHFINTSTFGDNMNIHKYKWLHSVMSSTPWFKTEKEYRI